MKCVKKWWRQTESNRRHKDFQSFALPTELWSHTLRQDILFNVGRIITA